MVDGKLTNSDDLPEVDECEAKQFSEWDYELVECLTQNPMCGAALSFGYGILCRHPKRREIVERMKNRKRQGGGAFEN